MTDVAPPTSVTGVPAATARIEIAPAIEEPPRWRGVNHLALTTNDMDATVRFYHGVLGMRLVATIGTPDFKHYFFELGPQNTLAFFEWVGHDVGTLEKPAGVVPDHPTQFDHLSFNLPDEQALIDLSDRLAEYACEVTEVVDHGFIRSIYFTDPNGISLEASYWVTDPTGRPANYADHQVMFTDLDPVPAVVEVAAGELVWTPSTSLVGDGTDDPA
jgi:catechol 2,3-dioxygenase-like lactoylglutathione lyase family enzyme